MLKAANIKFKDHIGQGQIRIPKKGRWAHNNVKLLHFLFSDMNLLQDFIFFFLVSQRIPCWDSSTVEYSERGLNNISPSIHQTSSGINEVTGTGTCAGAK